MPARVFSREMRRVGQKWSSGWVTACFLVSDRVRWWPLAGETGRARAPEREAIPPASLPDDQLQVPRVISGGQRVLITIL